MKYTPLFGYERSIPAKWSSHHKRCFIKISYICSSMPAADAKYVPWRDMPFPLLVFRDSESPIIVFTQCYGNCLDTSILLLWWSKDTHTLTHTHTHTLTHTHTHTHTLTHTHRHAHTNTHTHTHTGMNTHSLSYLLHSLFTLLLSSPSLSLPTRLTSLLRPCLQTGAVLCAVV